MNTETTLLDAARYAERILTTVECTGEKPLANGVALEQLRAAIAREEQAAREPQAWARKAAEELKAMFRVYQVNEKSEYTRELVGAPTTEIADIIQKHARQDVISALLKAAKHLGACDFPDEMDHRCADCVESRRVIAFADAHDRIKATLKLSPLIKTDSI